MNYEAFLHTKVQVAPHSGFTVCPEEIHPALKPHQRDAVIWALKGGRRALFESFGLGKTIQELEWSRLVAKYENGQVLIAFANECRRPGIDINFQTAVLFVAQDIDLIAGCMCYIQLSLLGCPGYVVVANTLTNPCTSIDGNALIPVPSENIWYTPFYFRDVWHWRRQFWRVQSLIEAAPAPLPEPEEIIPEVPAIPLTENKVGQLSFF